MRRVKNLEEAINEVIEDDTHRKRFEILYEILNILDDKTASLLTFNGIIIASFAILATIDSESWMKICYLSGMLPSVIACTVGFWVVRIEWHFLDYKKTPEVEFRKLAEIIDERTNRYRFSWKLSFSSVILLGLMTLISIYLEVLKL